MLRIAPGSRGSAPPELRSSVNAAAPTRRSSAGSARTGPRPFGALPSGVRSSEAAACGAGDAADRPDPAGQPQDAQHLGVDRVLADLPGPHRRGQLAAPRPVRARHGQVEPGDGGRHRAARGVPVGQGHPAEAPFVLEDASEQRAVFGHRDAVDLVVARHHQVHVRLAHAGLEWGQVQLVQHVLGDPRVVGPALRLGVVAHVVLDRRGRPGLVQAADERDGQPGDQHRVLAERLEAPPAERRAHDVDRRGQQDVDALAPGLGAERGGERLDQGGIPGGAEGRRAGQARRRVALVHGDAADPGRAVGHDHGPQPDGRQRAGAPVVRAGQQAHLVVQAERGEQVEVADILGVVGWRPAAGAAGRFAWCVHVVLRLTRPG